MSRNIAARLRRLKSAAIGTRLIVVPVMHGQVDADTQKGLAALSVQPRPHDLIIQRIYFNRDNMPAEKVAMP